MKTILVNEPQHPRLVRPIEGGGSGLDALWNDDFHHSAMVAMTGRNEAYYTDYLGATGMFSPEPEGNGRPSWKPFQGEGPERGADQNQHLF